MSGHSKWSTIKHKKAAKDAKRGKAFTKLIREITVATRMGNSGDPGFNPRLRTAILAAKAASMPNDNIDRAIKKGLGEGGGATYEDVMYEGYGPGGVAIMVRCLTDNRNRTVADVRGIFQRGGGSLGEAEVNAAVAAAKKAATFDGVRVAPDVARKLKLLKVALVTPAPTGSVESAEVAKLKGDAIEPGEQRGLAHGGRPHGARCPDDERADGERRSGVAVVDAR